MARAGRPTRLGTQPICVSARTISRRRRSAFENVGVGREVGLVATGVPVGERAAGLDVATEADEATAMGLAVGTAAGDSSAYDEQPATTNAAVTSSVFMVVQSDPAPFCHHLARPSLVRVVGSENVRS